MKDRTYLSAKELARYLGVSRRSVERWTLSGKLPQPVRFSTTCVRWHRPAVDRRLRALGRLPQG